MKKHLLFLGTFLAMTKLLAMEANWIALNINGTTVYTLDGENFFDEYNTQICLQIVYPPYEMIHASEEIELYKDNIPLGYEALDGETEASKAYREEEENGENFFDIMPYDSGILLGYSPLDQAPSDNETNGEEELVSNITSEKRDFNGDGVLNFKQRKPSRPISIIVPSKKEFDGGGVVNFKKGTGYQEKLESGNISGRRGDHLQRKSGTRRKES